MIYKMYIDPESWKSFRGMILASKGERHYYIVDAMLYDLKLEKSDFEIVLIAPRRPGTMASDISYFYYSYFSIKNLKHGKFKVE